MIYCAQLPTGTIKIGYSDDVTTRIEQLEQHYGVPLVLLYTEPGGKAEERAWHARFKHLRCGQTEQFRPGPDLMEAIGRPLLVSSNSETVEAIRTVKHVRMELPEEFHSRIKHQAVRFGLTVTAYIRLALTERIECNEAAP